MIINDAAGHGKSARRRSSHSSRSTSAIRRARARADARVDDASSIVSDTLTDVRRDGYRGAMRQAPLTLRLWSRDEYDRLVDQGMFEGEPLELIGGQLIVAEPQGSYHASAIGRVSDIIRAALPPGFVVRVQLPLALDDDSEPEPDIVVVPGTHEDYRFAHPTRATLVVEVAESSLTFDREIKASVYARGGIEDYWLVNLIDRVLEVCREPTPDPSAPWGWRYRSRDRLTPPATVALFALPDVRVSVGALIP